MIDGSSLIAGKPVSTRTTFRAYDPARGEEIGPDIWICGDKEVESACDAAEQAFDTFRELNPNDRADFLDAVADRIDALGDPLIERAMAESGLPRARLTGERGRTTGQLRLFAKLLRTGRWAGVTIDSALPERAPLPRPDLRQQRIALGPVAVFGASNFPLAFSVAGGDTASALAAGCPVVVKGHPAHPGTSEMVGRAIANAVADRGLPGGVFSLLQGPGNDLGTALVRDPRIQAVGFTGSRAGGLALVALAHQRPEPIPVYAEMSSVNPVILFPYALANRAEALARDYVASLTLGSGQFCTNPGLVVAIAGADLDRFEQAAADAIVGAQAQVMLTSGIHASYGRGVEAMAGHAAVQEVGRGAEPSGCNQGRAAVFRTDAQAFMRHPELANEVFGAASLVIRAANPSEVADVLRVMEGQLTITLQLDPADEGMAAPMIPLLERKAGRILANGWPTGVEVSSAMVHGGPYPATSDSRSTSVGTAAIERFLRPVCYQNMPDALLPAALKHGNPLGLPRLVDGKAEPARG